MTWCGLYVTHGGNENSISASLKLQGHSELDDTNGSSNDNDMYVDYSNR